MENEREENEVDKRSKSEVDGYDNEDKCKQEDYDVEKEKDPKYPYPKSVFFIISTEFCERFSYYGMKSKHLNTTEVSCADFDGIILRFIFQRFCRYFSIKS